MSKISLVFESSSFIFLFIFISPCLSCPEYQRQALLQFKHLLLGNNTTTVNGLESWNSTSTDCCEWDQFLISCDSSQQVIGLKLVSLTRSMSLKSVVTSDVLAPLFHLQTLEEFDISFNGIQGEIPGVGLANLTNLVRLRMNDNSFNGTIPLQLFSLRQLEHVNLMSNVLEGTLSSNIEDLSNMKGLHLDENLFHGQIPSQIGNLTRLESLRLSRSKFSGAIPSSLVRLTGLNILDLSYNLLSGGIPLEIGNLSNMIWLYLNDNNLSGEIPASFQRMGIQNYVHLMLQNNLLSGEIPTWLFDMNLFDLFLDQNRLTFRNVSQLEPRNTMIGSLSLRSCNNSGKIPDWLSNQRQLSYLDLSDNNLEGNLPEWLAQKSLVLLALSSNKFSGSMAIWLFQSQSLEQLILSGNNFSGLLPDTVGESTNLITLMLSDNDFFGPLPTSISNMSKLKLLDLSFNKFSNNHDSLNFNPNSSFVFVDLSFNQFSGQVPVTFPLDLNFLVLSNNWYSGGLPQKLVGFTQLAYLDLSSNNITGKIAPFLFQSSSLRILNLRDNFLEGSIPNNLADVTSLQILDLSSNKLTGNIPPNIGNLIGMTVDHNISLAFTHPFPALWVRGYQYLNDLPVFWKNLKQDLPCGNLGLYVFLDLSSNQLSGAIPDSLGSLIKLKSLNLSNNRLYGSIPASLGDIRNLESLDLSHNNLSGNIPEMFSKLLDLAFLNLSNNRLNGRIPNGPQMDRLNDPKFYANNTGLCSMQIQVPCENEKTPLKQEPVKEETNTETWFSWKMAAIGYPSGFVCTILVLYVTGYFNVAQLLGQRRRHISVGFEDIFARNS